jgi:membrane protein implicated in regulation of membrane protease activity
VEGTPPVCHLILLLPLLALPLFWLTPLSIALPAYVAVLALSGGIYLLAMRAMHRPVQTGMEALVHRRGEVLAKDGNLFRVRLGSELWNAGSNENLHCGDSVEVEAVENLRLRVHRVAQNRSRAPLHRQAAGCDVV